MFTSADKIIAWQNIARQNILQNFVDAVFLLDFRKNIKNHDVGILSILIILTELSLLTKGAKKKF